MNAKPSRRRYSAEYKRRMLREAAACKESGALGALLRREGLYSSHLSWWLPGLSLPELLRVLALLRRIVERREAAQAAAAAWGLLRRAQPAEPPQAACRE
ncbi:MAG: hypothetical protein HY744_06545 [Deltaproteobacteria bacterium]|nr:hypothetical protein [Deltaproteobacteria bacterium]